MQTTRGGEEAAAIPSVTFTCEKCLSAFNTREELQNHNVNARILAMTRQKVGSCQNAAL